MSSFNISETKYSASPRSSSDAVPPTMGRTRAQPESGEQSVGASLLVATSLPQLSCFTQRQHDIAIVEKCYTSYQEKINVTKKDLLSLSTSRKCQKKMKISPHLDAEVYLKPQTIREGIDCSMEVRLEAKTMGELAQHIRDKLKTCFIRVVTMVIESETNLVLAQYINKKLFPMTNDGSAGYEWPLLHSREMEKCTRNKLTICIEIFLHIREWRDFEASTAETKDDFVTIFTHSFSSD